ncbi:FAD-dependent oxidoreductase [Kineococcus rhizosphaerae]|uniref:Pyridine nucleotide-disulfide oxidoreductase n=1 Tax=Kineococcus rhizosphaerae TaxID=559628 RepID=A0A2T0QYY3_9ACTN|nr:FAD-dependent oxidoreductase [Kineococcus rhizosphaerae]PRY11738.1 pyridine nucleotide-disulfide oxidoreductase [Kineococcus rhizosphaerae]
MSPALATVDVVVIGAGQGGLSAAFFLDHAGLAPGRGYVVLDSDDEPGGAWRHRWPGLVMERVNGVHDLPGYPLGAVDPRAPAREVVPAYFAEYELRLGGPVRRPVAVHEVRPAGARLLVDSSAGAFAARAVVNATGTWTKPFWPSYPGRDVFRGRQLHTADYAGPAEFVGRHVVVVGGGISAVQHLADLADLGVATTWVTRSEPVFRDDFDVEARRAAVEVVARRVAHGEPPGSVVSATGLVLTPEVAALRERGVLKRHPAFARLRPDGVQWADGSTQAADVVLWATGFRPALDHLRPLHLREPGGGILVEGTRVVREPRLHLVGYGPSASTVGASRAAREAVREVLAGR